MMELRSETALSEKPAPVWVLTDGTIGMENQGVAVAEALGRPFTVKRIRRRGLTRRLPTWLQTLAAPERVLAAIDPGGDRLDPPWPKLLITIGRHSVPLSVAVRRASRGATATLHIQDPKVPFRLFDLIAAPHHDGLAGPNVISTEGAPHRVTAERLAAEGTLFAPDVEGLPRPRIAVLVGGASKAYRFGADEARTLGEDLRLLSERTGAALLVTPSRRTGAENTAILAAALKDRPARIWHGTGPNPYFGYLAHADAVIATADSVNMVTEAAGTGKPVYVYPMAGASRRFDTFHERMARLGVTRRFDGTLASWSYAPINDSEKIAEAVRKVLEDRL